MTRRGTAPYSSCLPCLPTPSYICLSNTLIMSEGPRLHLKTDGLDLASASVPDFFSSSQTSLPEPDANRPADQTYRLPSRTHRVKRKPSFLPSYHSFPFLAPISPATSRSLNLTITRDNPPVSPSRTSFFAAAGQRLLASTPGAASIASSFDGTRSPVRSFFRERHLGRTYDDCNLQDEMNTPGSGGNGIR